jgi:hypothetical protein
MLSKYYEPISKCGDDDEMRKISAFYYVLGVLIMEEISEDRQLLTIF